MSDINQEFIKRLEKRSNCLYEIKGMIMTVLDNKEHYPGKVEHYDFLKRVLEEIRMMEDSQTK